ncbi:MAG: polysaccharide biosynthesis tyrosine autokinase [Deltaproteobacteria bacterium]|nr:polysaccharide biosynthesis tyrosine autokinase [Deltaproteobacteria bacterium]
MERLIPMEPWKNGFGDPLYVKQVKTLRSKIIHVLDGSEKRVIGVTSSTNEEGKTTLALNIATAIAANGDKNVLLIDGDLTRCDMTDKLGFYGEAGLSDYLEGVEQRADFVFKNGDMKNLFFLSAGNPVENSSELLTKKTFKNLMDVVRRKFDVIILDLPPVISTPDPVAVKELVDFYIFVYHAGRTPRELLEHSINDIGNEKILGVVFNRVKKEKMLKYGKEYYYYNR